MYKSIDKFKVQFKHLDGTAYMHSKGYFSSKCQLNIYRFIEKTASQSAWHNFW